MKFLLLNKIILQLIMFIGIGYCLNNVDPHLALAYCLFIVCSWGTAFFDSQIRALQAQEIVDIIKKRGSDEEK